MFTSKYKRLEIKNACEKGDYELAESLLKNGAYVNAGLEGACLGGHKDLAQLLIDKWHATDFDLGLMCACRNNHKDLIQMMIDRGANLNSKETLNACLSTSCMGGHIDLAKIMIDKGANVNCGIVSACYNGYLELAQMLIKKGADPNRGLEAACDGGQRKIVHMLIDNGGTYWKSLLLYCNETKLIIRMLLRLNRKERKAFLCRIKNDARYFDSTANLARNLINRHLMKANNYKYKLTTRKIICVGQQFVCNDVAKFNARFVDQV